MKSGSLLRNTLLYVPAQLFAPLLQFAATIIWTHLFDPAAFGLIAFVVAAQELTGGLGLNWWSMYLMRFRKRYPGAKVARFGAMDGRIVAFGAAGQALLTAPVLIMVGVRPTPGLLAATFAYLATRTLLTHYSEWARSDHRIGLYTIAQLAGPVAGSGLSIVTALAFGPDPALALAALALGQAAGAAIVLVGLGLRLRLGRFDRAIFVEAAQYGLPLIFSGLFVWTASNGVRVLVEAGAGIVGVGLFSVGWGLGQRMANMLATLCNAAAFPLAVDRLEAGDSAGALRHVGTNGAIMIGLLAPATAGIAILAAPLVHLIVAPQFQEATIVILPLAMATAATRALRLHTGDQTALLLRRTGAMTIFNFLDAAITMACAAIGVNMGGIFGAAIGCLIGTLVGTAIAFGFVVAKLGLRIPPAALVGVLLATALMSAVLRLAPTPHDYLALVSQMALGVVAYSAAIATLFPQARRLVGAQLARVRIAPAG